MITDLMALYWWQWWCGSWGHDWDSNGNCRTCRDRRPNLKTT